MENGSGRVEDTRRKMDGRGGEREGEGERERERERQSGDICWEIEGSGGYKEEEGWK